MILLDFSQTMIGTFMAMGKGSVVVEEDLLRHTVLNTIRQYKHTHRHIYDTGGLVICCDSYKNWRKESFPEYKANRKKRRAEAFCSTFRYRYTKTPVGVVACLSVVELGFEFY